MRRVSLVLVGVASVAGCEKKEAVPRYLGPMPVTFGDCAGPSIAWVSGPRPAAFTPAEAEDVWVTGGAVTAQAPSPVAPPEEETVQPPDDESGGTGTAMAPDEGKMRTPKDQALARQQAIEMARNGGVIGSTALTQGGAFASLTGTGDISSGFDDSNIYGGLLGDEAGEMNSGYGYGRSGVGPSNGGTGWGTIGTGRYGTIGHGSGTGSGYGVGGGRTGMRGRSSSVPTVAIGQPNTQGALDKAIIRRYIKRNIQRIQYCYEKELLAKPGLSGTMTTQFFITPNGDVASSTGSGVDPEVAKCVAAVIKAIKFPKPNGGGGVQVNYPFTFRPADSSVAGAGSASGSADAGSAGSGSAIGGGSASSVSKPPPSATAKRRLYRTLGNNDPKYQPGAENPLRAEETALTECFRRTPIHWGTAVVELAYDPTGMVTNATVHGVDDKRLVTCVTAAAKRVKRGSPSGTAERCSVAFGEMPIASLPTLVITEDAVTMMGKTLADPKALFADTGAETKIPAVAEAITARVSAVTSQTSPVVSAHGPLVVAPVGTAKMKIVYRMLASILASGDDFVLAVSNGPTWNLLTPLALPVVPVPFGTGGVWNHVKVRSRAGDTVTDSERVTISILIREATIVVGLSRVNEFTELKREATTLQSLGTALKAHRAGDLLKGRTDVEIAAEDSVAYRDFVGVVQTAIEAGFVDWQLTDASSLSANPAR